MGTTTGPKTQGLRGPQHRSGDALSAALTGCFAGGLVLGRLAPRWLAPAAWGAVCSMVGGYVQHLPEERFGRAYASTFSAYLLLEFALFFCGFCLIALPLVFLAAVCCGAGAGASLTALFSLYSFKALPFAAVVLLPPMAAAAAVLLRQAHAAVRASQRLFREGCSEKMASERGFSQAPAYVKLFIFTVVFALCAAYYALAVTHFPFDLLG